MNKHEVKNFLEQLGSMLVELEQKKTIKLLLIGGAFMLTQIGNRQVTDDIDGKILNIADPMHSQDYLTLKNATHFVADENKLPYSWFSDNIGDFLTIAGPLPTLKLWLKAGKLEVYIPPASYILAHKFIAGRDKDDDDIRTLCTKLRIRTRNQAQDLINTHIPDQAFQNEHHVGSTLAFYFPNA